MRAILGVAAAFGLACAIVDCGSGTSSSSSTGSSSEQLAQFCGTLCGRINECDRTRDNETCTARCENDNASVFPKLRTDAVVQIRTCMATKDCKTVLDGTMVRTCADETYALLAPTDQGVTFCNQWSAAATKCGRRLDVAQCLLVSKQYNDATLERATSCFQKSCIDLQACIEANLDASFGGGPSGSVR